MKFDIKDVKSWANRHDVKVGDAGYFADSILVLDDRVNMNTIGIINAIFDRTACCFSLEGNTGFAFFLPVDAVKEDKPEKKSIDPLKLC